MTFRGVNLGGWLVLERWMTPSVFAGTDATDEFSLCYQLGPEQARMRLEEHRRTFITRDHIQHLANMGLTMLRVPVGYWLFEASQPFVPGADKYVDQLFVWADEFHLQIILDVHAAPGSQNGWDHSGHAGEIRWTEQGNVEATLRFVEQLAERYGNQPALYGIELLNEPHWDIPIDTLVDYYHRGHAIISQVCPDGVRAICSDSFRTDQMSKKLLAKHLNRLVMDMHMYQLFTPEDQALDLPGHLKKAAEWFRLLTKFSKRLPVMVGEWSAAMDEQLQTYTNEDRMRYFQAQREAFESVGIGWIYWTARTQDGGVWSLVDHPEFLQN
jgi:glucan 1,3-beta-glucosidase